jgi:CRISPR-associated endonuclease Csn1
MYAIVKISMRDAAKLAVAKSISEQKENETLNDIIDEKLSKISKNGKIAHELFEVVLPRVGQKTLFKNSKYNLFLVNSDTYMHNYQELWMPREYQKMWKDISLSKYGDAQTEDQLDQIFGFIVSQVNSYFNLYDINQFRKKLNDATDKFATLSIRDTDDMQGKIATIGQLLIGLQANAARSDLRNLDIKTPFGKLQIGNGITLDLDTSVIYQSPTGLFERKILLADL